MKLGEIKLEALRIMNINNDSELMVERMSTILGEKRYAKYLNNMFNSINKAIDFINHRKVLPQNSVPLSDLQMEEGSSFNRFDISSLDDFLSVDRILYEDNMSNYSEKLPYTRIGNKIRVLNKFSPEFLVMVYDTKIANIKDTLKDNEEVPGLKDEFARLIPYFIKFELYQEDEPDLALNAKSTFEQGIESLRDYDNTQECFSIQKIYSSED